MKSHRSFILILLLILLSVVQIPVLTAAPASQQTSGNPAKILGPAPQATDRWVVQLVPGVDVTAFAAQHGYQVLGNVGGMPGWYEIQIANTDKEFGAVLNASQTLAFSPQVIIFEQEYLIYTDVLDAPPTDPIYSSQWHLDNTGQFGGTVGVDSNVVPVWADNITGNGVHIGIIDDGLQYTHPDLDAPKFIASRSYDYADNNVDVAPVTSGANCSSGDNCHGTSVAGVSAGEANNAVCGAGAAYNATISGQRLITGIGLTDTQIANAFLNSLAVDTTPVDVSNNSWGFSAGSDPGAAMRAALQTGAETNNTIYLFAAGNGAPSNAGRSGLVNSRHTIAIGASTNLGVKSSYSEEGSAVFVSAPSNGGTASIYTTDLLGAGDGYGGIGAQPDCTNAFGGTSSATPLVSGVVALMLQANPALTWRDVQHILANSSTPFDLGDSSWQTNGTGHLTSNKYGFGRVNGEDAVDLASTWTTVGPYLNQNGSTVAVGLPIADGSGNINSPVYGAGTTSNFIVSGSTIDNLEHVEVLLTVTHVFGGTDLRVQLTSPSGTVSELYDLSQLSGSTNTFNAGRILMSVQFWDEDPNGQWTISVQDGWLGDTGTFVSWQLRLYGTEDIVIPTNTPTSTPTNTAVPTNTPTNTAAPTNTPTNTALPTNTPTNTALPTNTPTNTAVPTNTPTNTAVATNTPTNTAIPTNTPTSTALPTNTPTNTAVPTSTLTNTAIPTNTPTSTPDPTATDTDVPTSTPDPTATDTPVDTNTPGGPTETPTDTPVDTNTPGGPTETVTEAPTDEATVTPTEEAGNELVINGGFENLGGDGKPDVTPWVIKNASGDKAKCNKDKDGDGIPDKIFANTGNCAFVFKGVAGEAGKIQQNLDLTPIVPAVNGGLDLSFFAQSKGGATVKTKVVVKYADSSKTKITVESDGNEAFTEFTGAEVLTSADVSKAKISVGTRSTSGKVTVDDVSLLYTDPSSLISLPGDNKLNNSN